MSSVIVDDGKDQDDEDDTFVVEDTHPIHDDLDMASPGFFFNSFYWPRENWCESKR